MDTGVGLVVSSSPATAAASSNANSAPMGDKAGFGSGLPKQQEERNCSKGHYQMLSFSPSNSFTTPPFPYYHHTATRTAGMSHCVGTLSGFKLPFTPSQWMELEHQALIYKYISSNASVPPYLLNPIRKAFESTGFTALSTQRSNPLGWGAFHLGFSSSDPEPGRCRRTDGKKWRCSREAVVDQKYCERHMNRGRHRSRKPVEGHSGRAASGATTTTNKPTTPASSNASVTAVAAGNASAESLSHHHQLRNLQEQQLGSGTHALANYNRCVPANENNRYSIPRQQYPFQEFGLGCTDSLINPVERSSPLIHCRRSENVNDEDNKSQDHSGRLFVDAWPKNYSDKTQLSISIPMTTSSDFMASVLSSTSSTLQRSPQELEMGLRVGTAAAEHNRRELANWVPTSWESSITGPLGEVLQSTSNTPCDSLNKKHNWDNGPHLAASPTDVLQRGSLVSLSNSSAASSPRAESTKTPDGFSISNGIMNVPLPTV